MEITQPKTFQRKKSFYEKIGGKDLYPMLLDMGNSMDAVKAFQTRRMLVTLLMCILGIVGSIVFKKWWISLIGLALGLVLYYQRYTFVKSLYRSHRYSMQFEFAKFMRLMIPFLLQESRSLYSILNEVYNHVESDRMKQNIQYFMMEMSEHPNAVEPYIHFAKECSGSDVSTIFMTTVYDFQQSSSDTSIIEELGELASEEMFNTVDNIIDMKVRRFAMFPTKLTMSTFILTIGFMVGVLIKSIAATGLLK